MAAEETSPKPKLTVAVAGASGLIGSEVCALLRAGGHEVRRLVRGANADVGPNIPWDPTQGKLAPESLAGVDAVINLAGRSIGTRFTRAAKREMLRSRLDSAALLADAAARAEVPTYVQASAIGYYGPRRPGELLTETSRAGSGFLADLCAAWEEAGNPGSDTRSVYLRTGLVLSADGGSLPPQLKLFRLGLGGRITRAGAYQSWISLTDIARMYVHAVTAESLSGPVNAVAPQPVTATEFARTLGAVLRRPALLPAPPFGPALVLGREGARELVHTDQNVSCHRVMESGFNFSHPLLEGALRAALA
ncbi:TIGR01777 family oxidoreductase [Dermabacteraceae bacterium P13264]